jgi:hypothetical protein
MTIPQFRIHWKCNNQTGNGAATYPESRAKELAAQLNGMAVYKREGRWHWAEPVKVAPVVRPSYKRHLEGLE